MAGNKILYKRLSSQTSALLGAGGVRFDPAGTYARTMLQKDSPTRVESGIVIRSGCTGYDCAVKMGMYEVPCNILCRQSSNGFGVAYGDIPIEGSEVWVLLRRGSYSVGWILGVIPRANHLASNDTEQARVVHPHYPNGYMSPFDDNSAYNLAYIDPQYSAKLYANANRPGDVHPGESVVENENHVGVLNSMYAVEVTGGNSFIRVDRIDDEIRMRSTNFTKWTDEQAVSEFNDGGYISAEGREYSYQGERLGDHGLSGQELKGPEDIVGKEPRARTKFWKGFLGNLFSWFVIRPGMKTKQKTTADTGLVSVHASQAGNLMVRSVGGVSLERYDRIPVPYRAKQPWDPSGDRETETTHMPLRQFVTNDPHARALEESSKMAWEQASMYRRFDELKKDFITLQEKDISGNISNSDGDPPGSSELNLSGYSGRRAGVFVGDDGSLILRDAWGSEVVMLGGNVLINTPGNVITTANRDIVSIARQGVIIRGTDAAEISSEEKNVRIHARKLVAIAGGTNKTSGGVLIESLAESATLNAKEAAGDEASVNGVVIRSEDSHVSIAGKNSYVLGKDAVFVSGGDDDKTRNGSIFIDGENVVLTGSSGVMNVCGDTSMSVVSGTAMMMASKTAVVAGRKSAMVVSDNKIPKEWVPTKVGDLYSLLDTMQTLFDTLQPDSVIEPFSWKNQVENALFTFRTSVQAKTNKGIEPWKGNSKFTLYEPWWQVMVSMKDPMATGKPHHPDSESIHGSMSWPYLEARQTGQFMAIAPKNLYKGYPIERDKLEDREEPQPLGMKYFTV